ncbi:MAG: inosine monophosphate cyclohydrolase [bacterium]|nr:inosine monophosphate cyclohydrolase [bacterium]
MTSLAALASASFASHLEQNPYPGRGLVIGREASGEAWLQVYWIMGRSPNSQNRVFVADGPELRTEPHDPSAVEDPTNIIYEAMLELPGLHIVSNGDQTRTVADALASGGSFEAALATRERETDAPNYTPRISGLLDLRGAEAGVALSILRANDADPAFTDRTTFRPAAPPPGLGRALTTYQGDGSPLPSFRGDPLWLPLEGDADAVADCYWGALDCNNRVALAVKRVPADGGPSRIWVRNRHS